MSNLLREYIASILTERGQALAPVALTNSQVKLQLTSVMQTLADVSQIKCKGKLEDEGHCRIFLNDLKDKTDNYLKKLAKDSIKAAFGGRPTVENIGQVHSGTYDTYKVTDSGGKYSYNIVFSGGLTSGQRGGGYEYEAEVKSLLGIGGTNIEDAKTDVTLSDVFVKTKKGKDVGIEVKGAGAKFGQPTLQYNYTSKIFIVPANSNSIENAELVVNILNVNKNVELSKWLKGIQKAWNKLHPEDKMKNLGTQIKPKDWDEMMTKFEVGQSGQNVPMELDQIVTYYKKKKAHYLQIQGKGLYAFNDILNLGVTTFVSAATSLNAFIKPEILLSGGNKVLRASINLNYRTLSNSNMDLANLIDAKKFSVALKKS